MLAEPAVRQASSTDVAAIERLVADCYGKYVERIGRPPAPMSADYTALVASGSTYVLEDGGEIVGVIVLIEASGHLEIGNVAVSPHRQGRGWGSRLLRFAEDRARERAMPEMRLFTNERMHENLAIYARLGWSEYARAETDGFRRVYLRKAVL